MATKTATTNTTPDPVQTIADGVTRKVNQKLVKKIRVNGDPLPVVEVVHTQDGADVTYKAKNGRKKTVTVERGEFSSRLITGYPSKASA